MNLGSVTTLHPDAATDDRSGSVKTLTVARGTNSGVFRDAMDVWCVGAADVRPIATREVGDE